MSVLRIQNLQAYYQSTLYGVTRNVKAVDGVSLDLRANEIYGIAGESSCGKTSLIKVVFGAIKPPLTIIGGRVLYQINDRDFDITQTNDETLRQMRWKQVSYILQGSMSLLNPVRRVRKTFWDFTKAHEPVIEPEKFEATTREHLNRLGLPAEVLDSYPHQLSGGMKQRVAIALATIFQPKVILADEPTTALDVVVQRGVLQLLRRIQQETKNTLVIVTHDMGIHANIADRVGIMYAGRIVEEGTVKHIFSEPRHPYTKHLIQSLPKIGDKSKRQSIPGAPPNLADPPAGCRFHPRCPYAKPICSVQTPELSPIQDERRVACFLLTKENAHVS
ncbi:MAG: ABC transporter ATP-binding protein [Firmicutes bacterium]|jgi:peptide/nickel transport system ATP-binding protein|nr:ABC transporter ATP-binding protein [Bacillota bacterium]